MRTPTPTLTPTPSPIVTSSATRPAPMRQGWSALYQGQGQFQQGIQVSQNPYAVGPQFLQQQQQQLLPNNQVLVNMLGQGQGIQQQPQIVFGQGDFGNQQYSGNDRQQQRQYSYSSRRDDRRLKRGRY
eukprot:TRINITY_DN7312_c0_g1_i4.p2 TRINITY_DN7312_c0_g1~~TRINITY_DN7312_c0_g1_i4.p2  ORF type:complete len:128 (+),score=14.94 TRINITY_DN7312_c0_g1_i4:2-385(+)